MFMMTSEPLNAGSDLIRGPPPTPDRGATRKNQSRYFRASGVSSSSLPPAAAEAATTKGWTDRAKRRGISATRSALLWLEQFDS
jgi:hypothetical protein